MPVVLAGLLALQPLSTDLYQAALPALGNDLAAAPPSVQATVTVFMLVFGLWQLAAGPLSDRFGRRPVLFAGLATYVAASTLCAFAPSLPWLIAGRVGQALGACSCLVCVRAVVRDTFEPAQGARTLASASTIYGSLALLLPIVGALLATAFGWRATFAAMIAAACAVALAVVTTLGETNRHRTERLHPGAIARSYAAVLRNPTWNAYTWGLALSNGATLGFLAGGAYVLIRVLGLTPFECGLCFSAVVLGYIVGTLVCRQTLPRLGMQAALRVGLGVVAFASLLLAGLALAGVRQWWAIVVPHCLYMVGHGQIHPVAMAGSVARFPRNAGTASAAMGAATMLIGAATGQWVGFAFDGTPVPLALTMAACGLCAAAVTVPLIRRYGKVD